MKAVVAAFNQEKALRDCTTSPINRFAALAVQCDAGVFIVMVGAAV